MRFGKIFTITLAFIFFLAGPIRAADDWREPKDGLFTEKQLTNYLAAYKDWQDILKAYGKAVESSKSNAGALVVVAGLEDKLNDTLKKHDLKRPEFDWLGARVIECFGVSLVDEQTDTARKDFSEQKKKSADEIEAQKKRIDEYEQAQKNNTRVMTPAQRDDAIKSAKERQASALDEVKQHEAEAKEAADEASMSEADAKKADDLAKNPPSDVDADGKADYVKARQEEATSARDLVKEARAKEETAKAAVAESKTAAAAAANAAFHPETPVTDDDKAQVKKENEEAIAGAKDELKSLDQTADILKNTDTQFAKQTTELHKSVKEPNLALVKKHLSELKSAWGIDKK